MKLLDDQALGRLTSHDHAVLSTVHPERGVDAVPVVYAVAGRLVGVPIDTVKPKASLRLQRERNLEADPRATLLAEHWDRDDWSALWWVRAELRWLHDANADDVAELTSALVSRYPQYHERPFHRILVFEICGLTGWAAAP